MQRIAPDLMVFDDGVTKKSIFLLNILYVISLNSNARRQTSSVNSVEPIEKWLSVI